MLALRLGVRALTPYQSASHLVRRNERSVREAERESARARERKRERARERSRERASERAREFLRVEVCFGCDCVAISDMVAKQGCSPSALPPRIKVE